VAGNYVNNLDICNIYLPGNFGVRILDNLMPTSLSDVFRPRKSANNCGFVCDYSAWVPPALKNHSDIVDFHSDDEDNDMCYALKVPNL
jgi:hypothetical protein